MAILKLKIDVSGTVGDEAWRNLRQFDEIQSAAFGPRFGSSGICKHAANLPHAKGEWIGAEITLQTPLWPSMQFRITWSRSACSMQM